eukprot:4926645-Pyramimonas_sp.AAC.2
MRRRPPPLRSRLRSRHRWREYTLSWYQSRKGRENIPLAGANRGRGERISRTACLASGVCYRVSKLVNRRVDSPDPHTCCSLGQSTGAHSAKRLLFTVESVKSVESVETVESRVLTGSAAAADMIGPS